MKNRTRAALLLTATLIIGIILGSLISGNLRRDRINTIITMSPKQRFVTVLDRLVQADSLQHAAIDSIVSHRLAPMLALYEYAQIGAFIALDSIQHDLEEMLAPQQQEALDTQISNAYKVQLRKLLRRLRRTLSLSKEQTRRAGRLIREIDRQARDEYPQIIGDFTAMERATRLRMARLESGLKTILTPEQWQRYQKMKPHLRPSLLR